MDVWNKLSPKMKVWLDDEIQVYSNIHFRGDPEGRHGGLAASSRRRARRSTGCPPRTCRNSSASPCRSGSNGRTRTRMRRGCSSCSSTSWSRRRSATSRRTCTRDSSSTCEVDAVRRRNRPCVTHRVRRAAERPPFAFTAWHLRPCPNSNFILPHWLYWAGLIAVPADRDVPRRATAPRADGGRALRSSSPICSGYCRVSRHRIASICAAPGASVFIPVFLAILYANRSGARRPRRRCRALSPRCSRRRAVAIPARAPGRRRAARSRDRLCASSEAELEAAKREYGTAKEIYDRSQTAWPLDWRYCWA